MSIKLKQPTMWLATLYMSIKLKQSTMRLATLVFFVNLVMLWNGHVLFFNSLNKMTNAAYENAMRRCPRN